MAALADPTATDDLDEDWQDMGTWADDEVAFARTATTDALADLQRKKPYGGSEPHRALAGAAMAVMAGDRISEEDFMLLTAPVADVYGQDPDKW